jgi:hypothetical protein
MPIKSALEIALERTKDLKVDPKALAAAEAKQEGKRLAGEFLSNPDDFDFMAKFNGLPKEKREAAKEGAFEVFTARIQLPTMADMNPEKEFSAIELGLKGLSAAASGEKHIGEIFKQLGGFLKQYLEDAKKVDEAIRKQYAPRLKAKEQEMAARMGRAVRIDPMSDPEFAAFYKQNVGQMKAQYQAALDQAKEDLSSFCGIKERA